RGGHHRPALDHAHPPHRRADALSDRGLRALLSAQRHRRARIPAGEEARDRSLRAPQWADRHAPRRCGPRDGVGVMKARIAVLGGDVIGPDVVAEATRCLRAVAAKFGHDFELIEAPFGGVAIDAYGDPLPADTLKICLEADAVLLGAIGGPKWS